MLTLARKVSSALLLVLVAAAPMACLNINSPPKDQPKTDVNVGGQHGVTVEHGTNNPDNPDKPSK